jgi:hypothetical protein
MVVDGRGRHMGDFSDRDVTDFPVVGEPQEVLGRNVQAASRFRGTEEIGGLVEISVHWFRVYG